MTGPWRYVPSRSYDEATGETLWEIRELYPTDDGGFGFTADAVGAVGETLAELRRDLTHMLTDLELPILDLTVDPPQLVAHTDLAPEHSRHDLDPEE